MKLLKKEYNRRAKLRPLLWDNTIQLPLEDVYTRLKIVSRSKTKGNEVNTHDIFEGLHRGKFVAQAESHEVNMYDDILSFVNIGEIVPQPESDEVNVYDIFRALNKGEDVMTLVEGNPGIGKTTFCLKLAYDWANQNTATTFNFPKFELVLLLKCRDIDGGILDAIIEQLLPKDINENIREKLLEFLKDIHNQEKILIILDGLDELPEKSKRHVDELLHRRILPFSYVLATSRQERGIDARKKFVFDILLQIEGFTESDAFEYIRKHFKNVGPEHSLKGERLIREIKENTLLHALRNNPLNLLLLCIIYQDYEGKLPSSRTELYQIIVRCLLRRYCAKHNLKLCEDDRDLDKQFKKELLALGKLAWKCLLNDRHSFREDELKELEKRNDKLVARGLGLLYKEESLKKLNPQHQYYFLHKTFQEHLAALYIVHKLRRNKFNVFEHLDFNSLVEKYPQVFLFVAGMLGEEANILFSQIGEKLRSSGDWDWHRCSKAAANYFVESFSECGNAEQMAGVLLSFIPFPVDAHLTLQFSGVGFLHHFADVLRSCKKFSNIQKPVTLNLSECSSEELLLGKDVSFVDVSEVLESCSQLRTLNISLIELTKEIADVLFERLSASNCLSALSLAVQQSISCDVAVIIGKGLAASKSLTEVMFTLSGEWRDAWAAALEKGLSADTPLTSVVLRIHGLMSKTAIQALEKLLSNKSLASLSLTICGDLQDLLAAALSRGLKGQTVLKSLDLCVEGRLSFRGANLIERGLTENCSLNDLRVSVFGELPDNWQAIVENLQTSKKSQVSFAFHPEIFCQVTSNQVAHFLPFTVEKGLLPELHLTVNLWGELSCEGAEGLCETLMGTPLSCLTLNVHGKLADGIASCKARYVNLNTTVSSVSVNIWGNVPKEEKNIFQGILDKNPAVKINVHDMHVCPDESSDDPDVFVDGLTSLPTLITQLRNTRQKTLSVSIFCEEDNMTEHWHLSHALMENTSLNALTLTTDGCDTFSNAWVGSLVSSLQENTSLNALTLKMNDYGNFNSDLLVDELHMSLNRNRSLKALTMIINSYDKGQGLSARSITLPGIALTFEGMSSPHTSLNAFTLTVNSYGTFSSGRILNFFFSTPLSSLTLTISIYSDISDGWDRGLGDVLAKNKSLSTLNLTLNIYGEGSDDFLPKFWDILMRCKSLTTLRLQLNDQRVTQGSRGYDLSKLVVKSKSLSLIDLTVSFYGVQDSSSAKI